MGKKNKFYAQHSAQLSLSNLAERIFYEKNIYKKYGKVVKTFNKILIKKTI